MKKALSLLLVFLLAFTLLTGCQQNGSQEGGQGNDAQTSTTDGVSPNSNIVLLNFAEASTMFPLDYGTVADSQPMRWVYDTLLELDDKQNQIWMLASGCDVSEDGKEYTFHLREGISFSDGTPWNAEAAKANFDLMGQRELGYKQQAKFSCIEKSEVIDQYTIKVYLNQVYAPFLNVMAQTNASMVCPTLIEKGYNALATEVIGTGQYKLKEHKVGEYSVYELNRDWWGYSDEICGGKAIVSKECGFNTITLRPVTEEATRVAMLVSGEADISNSISHTNVSTLEASNIKVINKVGYSLAYFYMNNQKEIFKNLKVRQAIAMAIDVDSLNKVVYGGVYEKATSFNTRSINYHKDQTPWKYDVEKAKALLAEAGYPNGFSVVCWEENDTTDIQRGEFIQQQLEAIGVKLQIYPQEGGFLTQNVNGYSGDPDKTEFDCYIRGYSASTGDSDQSLGRFVTNLMPPLGANYSFYSNPEFDEYISQGASSVDTAVRKAAYEKAQEIIWNDVAAVPLLSTCYSGAFNSHIEGLVFSGGGTLDIRNAKYVE